MTPSISSTTTLTIHPLFILGFWLVSVSFFLAIALAMRDGIQQLRRLHRVPCSRCAFYTGEYRLKCTVNPCQALTEEAIGCLDYEKRAPKTPGLSAVQLIFAFFKTRLSGSIRWPKMAIAVLRK
ncbi:MAG: hypothetical protein ACPGVO_16540 [Spirulinaceae cyanobacterium]